MRITLVQAPHWSVVTPSYAVALLTGNLRTNGFEVFAKDLDVRLYHAVSREEQRLWESDRAKFWNDTVCVLRLIGDYDSVVEGMVDDILRDRPQVVGFSVKLWTNLFSLILAQRLKQRAPEVFVLFGGPNTTTEPADRFLRQFPQVDALCRQEADLSLPRFLRQFERTGRPQSEPGFVFRTAAGEIVDGGLVRDLPDPAEIPWADYSSFDFAEYLNPRAITMEMSRGCVNRCSYCSEWRAFGRYRAYPAEPCGPKSPTTPSTSPAPGRCGSTSTIRFWMATSASWSGWPTCSWPTAIRFQCNTAG